MVQPLRDYVLLEKVPDEKKVGKIILATSNDNESALATVVAVGCAVSPSVIVKPSELVTPEISFTS